MTDAQADRLALLRYAVEGTDLDVAENGDSVVASGGGMRFEIAPNGDIQPEGIDASILSTALIMAHSRLQEDKAAEAATAAEAARPTTLVLPPALQVATGVSALTVEGPGLMPVAVPVVVETAMPEPEVPVVTEGEPAPAPESEEAAPVDSAPEAGEEAETPASP
jgi:hypothetical protein